MTQLSSSSSSKWFLTVFLLLIHSAAVAQGFDLSEVKKHVRSFMDTTHVSGVAISLIKNGSHQELYFGNAGPGKKDLNDQTLFEIGSITKVFVSHLATLAQEEGKLSITDPISKYIPALQGNPAFAQISIKDLANHTSSLPPYYESPKNIKTKEEFIQWLLKWKPLFSPKTKYAYSNVGIALMGLTLEEVYRRDLEDLLMSKIFSPRKMASTYLNVPMSKRDRIALPFEADQKPVELLPLSWLVYRSGWVKSTASDLGTYLASWDQKFYKHFNESVCFINHSCQGLGVEIHPLIDLQKMWLNVRFTIEKRTDSFVKKDEQLPPLSQIFVDKTGNSDGMSAYIAMIPNRRVGVVILENQRNFEERVSLGRKILSLL